MPQARHQLADVLRLEEQVRRGDGVGPDTHADLEAENARLKRMYADLALENAAIKDVLAKNSDAVGKVAGGQGRGDRAAPVDQASLQRSRLVAGGVVQGAATASGEGRGGHRCAQRRRRA